MLKKLPILAIALFLSACATGQPYATQSGHTCTQCAEKHCTHEKECTCGCSGAEMSGKTCRDHMGKSPSL